MKRIRLYTDGFIIAMFAVTLLFACSKDGGDGHAGPAIAVMASETSLIPDKHTKTVSVVLNFNALEGLAYLMVQKSGGVPYSLRIDQQALSAAYTLTYAIQPTDPESFQLILKAYAKDGQVSKDLALTVDNRWGFFIRNVRRIARVTGRPMGGESFPSPNRTAAEWNVGGTDLGVVWEMDPGKYGIFFGDTFGSDFVPNAANPGPNGGNWRCNVLAFSEDKDLSDGLLLTGMATGDRGDARELLLGGKDQSGNGDWTSIPTAAIRANGADYVHYFNLRSWTGWVTNYSGMYKSLDNGLHWEKCEQVLFAANSHFGQVGYFKKDGYVYMLGTQTGRDGPAYLARFRESDIEMQDRYEYWDGGAAQWQTGDESKATVLIDDKVGELSFIFNTTHQKWIMAYFNADRYQITMRTAEAITGPWSDPYELAAGTEYAQLYGSYFHPLSVQGDSLYFLMSMWMPYNVFLMKAELADMGGAG